MHWSPQAQFITLMILEFIGSFLILYLQVGLTLLDRNIVDGGACFALLPSLKVWKSENVLRDWRSDETALLISVCDGVTLIKGTLLKLSFLLEDAFSSSFLLKLTLQYGSEGLIEYSCSCKLWSFCWSWGCSCTGCSCCCCGCCCCWCCCCCCCCCCLYNEE